MVTRAHTCLLALCLLPLAGCSKPSPPDQPQLPVEHRRHSELALAQALELEERFSSLLTSYIQTESTRHAPPFVPAQHLSALGLPGSHVRALGELYAMRKDRPLWVDLRAGGLSAQGKELLDALQTLAPDHAISPSTVRLHHVEDALRDLESQSAQSRFTLDWQPAHRQALTRWFESNPLPARDHLLLGQLLRSGGPLESFSKDVATLIQTAATANTRHTVELLLSDALVRYARVMRLENDHWYPKDPQRTPELHLDIMARRITHALRPLFKQDRPVRPLLARLQPPFEQYERLIPAYNMYAGIVAQGGWKRLPDAAAELRPGHTHPLVPALKERLRAEGFWQGDATAHYSTALADAVTRYQHTHQIWEKGHMTAETIRSMNVPADRRLLRLAQSLARWRKTRLAGSQEYVYVNVPDFHAEVWADGARKMRFKVVTGSAQQKWNSHTKTHERPRATKLFSDTIEYMVFNPYWNVPREIVEHEILPNLEENPTYLEENGYEWVEVSAQERMMRQLPGGGNALGDVKFIFPNDHSIYMHDTPDKGFFDYPIRAFSHGCVRVQDPMKFAQYLLERDGNWDEEKLKSWQRSDKELWFRLSDPLPVHIEYVVARVDDEGSVHFLADVYNHDTEGMTQIAAQGAADAVIESARHLIPPPEIKTPVRLAQN